MMNLKKPGKVSVIWNVAAKIEGVSLNSALLFRKFCFNSDSTEWQLVGISRRCSTKSESKKKTRIPSVFCDVNKLSEKPPVY